MTRTIPGAVLAAAALAMSAPAPAAAPPAKPTAAKSTAAKPATASSGAGRDVRCLMLANMYAKVAAASLGKEAAGQARLFYLGRISSRVSDAQLAGVMATQAKTIDPATAGTEMNACAATVKASAAAVEAAGSKVRATIPPPSAGPENASGPTNDAVGR